MTQYLTFGVISRSGKSHVKSRIKLDRRLEWVRPYIELTAQALDLSALKIIKASPANTQQHGCLYQIGNRFEMSLTLGLNVEDTLHTLAHECQHLVEWEHNYTHLKGTGRLFALFTKHAEKLGTKLD